MKTKYLSKDMCTNEEQRVSTVPWFENSMSFSQEIHQVRSHQGKTKHSDINTCGA